MKKVFAVILAAIMLFALSACKTEEPDPKPNEIRWPNTEMVGRLPEPDSLSGKVTWEDSEEFSVELLDVTYESYEDYVDACMDNGFTVDYYHDESDYWAYDGDGYEVSVDYDSDMLIMSISICAPDEEEDEEYEDVDDEDDEKDLTTTTEKPATTTEAKFNDDIDPDFKKEMDAYEKFMGEYVDFMKKYMDNPTDMSLLGDYATFMSDYNEYCDDFADWEDEDLNDAELDYYLDVQTRVNKKLLEVAQ